MKTTALLVVALLSVSMNLSADRLPPDAEALQAKRDAKVAEINQAYATALEKLMKKAMAEGNLDAAKVIEKEIEKASPNPFDLAADLLKSGWSYSLPAGSPTLIEFRKDFTAVEAETGKLIWTKWDVSGERLVATYTDGNTCVFDFDGKREGRFAGKTALGATRFLIAAKD